MQSITVETKQGKVTMIQEETSVNFYDRANQILKTHNFDSVADATTCYNNNVRFYM